MSFKRSSLCFTQSTSSSDINLTRSAHKFYDPATKTQLITQRSEYRHQVYTHLVNELVVQEAVNPVDAHVGEEQEGDHTQENPRPA